MPEFHPPDEFATPVHDWFGLTYASYFVMPRSALQAMSVDWQKRFVAIMKEMEATGIETPEYSVQRRDDQGRFVKDEWAEYRHPQIQHLLPESLR